MEQVIHAILLALHNLALVGCAAAPFYNRNLVVRRGQYGPKLHYELDKVVEETLQGNAPYCMLFIATLFFTGLAIPVNHYFFNGAFKQLHAVACVAVVLKLLCVFAMVVMMGIIFFKINPRLRELFATFQPGMASAAEREKEFFSLRSQRKTLCEKCLWFAVGVLIFSAFLSFGS